MAIGAKAQAEPRVAPKSATSLANDVQEESVNDYVGYRYLDLDPSSSVYTVKIEPVTLENIEPGDKLIPPSYLSRFRKVVTPDRFKKRARKTKWKMWRYSALCSVIPLGYVTLLASELTGFSSFFSSEAIGTLIGLSPLAILLPMFSLLFMFLTDFLGQVDESEVEEIPFLRIREFRRLDGTPYDLNTPNYEEIYEALGLLNKVSTLSDSVKETKKAIEDLRMARKTAKTMSSQAELHETLDRLQNEIPVLEERVAESLARKSEGLDKRYTINAAVHQSRPQERRSRREWESSMKKSSKARAQDPQDVMENTATELAENAVIADPHVAIGIRDKDVVLLRVHEVTEEDMLFRREILERDRDLIESGKWLKKIIRRPRLKSLVMGITGSAMVVAGFATGVVMSPTEVETMRLAVYLMLGLSVTGILLAVPSFVKFFETRIIEGEKVNTLKLTQGLEAPRGFRRNDGSRYVMNTPNYDELYEAFELLNEADDSHNSLESISRELSRLVSARKDEKTLARIAELESDQEKHENLVKDYEDRIAVLLSSDGAGNESINVTLIERGGA